MQMPNVRSTIRDEEANVTYHVLAHRSLARDELAAAVTCYHSQPSVRRHKTQIRNTVITIITTNGARGGCKPPFHTGEYHVEERSHGLTAPGRTVDQQA